MLGGRQRAVLVGSFLLGVVLVALPHLVQVGASAAVLPHSATLTRMPPVESGDLSIDSDLFNTVAETAMRYNLDPALVMAVIEVESGRDPNAVSSKGAIGLMQVMPETAAMVGFPEAADPAANLAAGCRYLSALLDSFGGDVELALAAYNAGPGAVRHWGTIPPYRETRQFVARVAAAYHRLTGSDLVTATRVAGEPLGLS